MKAILTEAFRHDQSGWRIKFALCFCKYHIEYIFPQLVFFHNLFIV